MPCYDPRDRIDRENNEIAAAVRGFLLCHIMTTLPSAADPAINALAHKWLRTHQEVDRTAAAYKIDHSHRYGLERAREDLSRVERFIHEQLVRNRLLERI